MAGGMFCHRGIVRLLSGLTALSCLLMTGVAVSAEGLYRIDYVFDCRYQPKTGEGYAGYAVHVHNSDCFDSYYERVCELPLIPPHVHDESCYDGSGNLICGQLELHTHTDSCYDDSGKLICGKLELEEHVHGPECFRRVIVERDEYTGDERVVSEPDAGKREIASKLGAARVIDSMNENLEEIIMEETGGEGVDRVVMAIGVNALVNSILKLAKKGGTVCLFAGFPKGKVSEIDASIIHYNELNVTGSTAYRRIDYLQAADMVREKMIDLDAIVSDKFSLDDFRQALDLHMAGTGLKVVIED